jgi:hypothetical protein
MELNYIYKIFKVVAISSNTNSFGLRAVILMAEDGEAYRICCSDINLPKVGRGITQVKKVELESGKVLDTSFMGIFYEIPEQLPSATIEEAKKIWEEVI